MIVTFQKSYVFVERLYLRNYETIDIYNIVRLCLIALKYD